MSRVYRGQHIQEHSERENESHVIFVQFSSAMICTPTVGRPETSITLSVNIVDRPSAVGPREVGRRVCQHTRPQQVPDRSLYGPAESRHCRCRKSRTISSCCRRPGRRHRRPVSASRTRPDVEGRRGTSIGDATRPIAIDVLFRSCNGRRLRRYARQTEPVDWCVHRDARG